MVIHRVLKQRSYKLAVVGMLAFAGVGGTAYATSTTAVAPSANHSVGAARGAAGDVLVGECCSSRTVLRIHPNGTHSGRQTVVKQGHPLNSPVGLSFGPKGVLYVSDYALTGIVRINPSTGHTVVIKQGSPFGSLSDVRFGPGGMLYATDFDNPTVWKVNPKTGHTSALATGGKLTSDTYDLAIGPSGAIYVVTLGGRVVKVDPKTGHQTLISRDPRLTSLWGIAVSSMGKIYVLNRSPDKVFRIDPSKPSTSNARVITTGTNLLSSAYQLAFTLKGKLLTANLGNENIVQIDPRTGHESVAFSGGMLSGPEGVTVQP